jgi:hypothetical protein
LVDVPEPDVVPPGCGSSESDCEQPPKQPTANKAAALLPNSDKNSFLSIV